MAVWYKPQASNLYALISIVFQLFSNHHTNMIFKEWWSSNQQTYQCSYVFLFSDCTSFVRIHVANRYGRKWQVLRYKLHEVQVIWYALNSSVLFLLFTVTWTIALCSLNISQDLNMLCMQTVETTTDKTIQNVDENQCFALAALANPAIDVTCCRNNSCKSVPQAMKHLLYVTASLH